MSYVNIEMGNHSIYFDIIAAKVVEECEEAEFLRELATQTTRLVGESKDVPEREFAIEARKRLLLLAVWFDENQP